MGKVSARKIGPFTTMDLNMLSTTVSSKLKYL